LRSGSSSSAQEKRAALTALFETHFERVSRYIAVRIGNRSEAEDLASEVFVRALRSVESYKETGAPLEAWVFRIAHNIVVDHLRRQGRRPGSIPLEDAPPVSREENPSARLEHEEELQGLRRALEKLSEAQRQVLALKFGAELSSEQIAQAMGKKPGAIREMQSAAVKKLRSILSP
jgi:RNA polymerase sigma-70 factor (ECF subfamily)